MAIRKNRRGKQEEKEVRDEKIEGKKISQMRRKKGRNTKKEGEKEKDRIAGKEISEELVNVITQGIKEMILEWRKYIIQKVKKLVKSLSFTGKEKRKIGKGAAPLERVSSQKKIEQIAILLLSWSIIRNMIQGMIH